MKVACSKSTLEAAVQTVKAAVNPKVTLPVLGNILMEAKKNVLRLLGSDLELTVEKTLEVNVKQEGGVAVPARIFQEIVAVLPDGEVTLERLKETSILKLSSGDSLYEINGLSAEEFPRILEVREGNSFQIPAEALKDMIFKTVYAVASPTESRQVLTGLLFLREGNSVSLVATNAHRLAVKTVLLDGKSGQDFSVVVPSRTFSEVMKVLSTEGAKALEGKTITITVSEVQVLFQVGATQVFSRIIDDPYPPFKQVVPVSSKVKWRVEVENFYRAVKGASIVAREDTNVLKLKSKGSQLFVSAATQDVGQATEKVQVSQEGQDIEIAFNAEYLLDILSHMSAPSIEIWLNTDVSPGLIKPKSDENYTCVIMPVRTS